MSDNSLDRNYPGESVARFVTRLTPIGECRCSARAARRSCCTRRMLPRGREPPIPATTRATNSLDVKIIRLPGYKSRGIAEVTCRFSKLRSGSNSWCPRTPSHSCAQSAASRAGLQAYGMTFGHASRYEFRWEQCVKSEVGRDGAQRNDLQLRCRARGRRPPRIRIACLKSRETSLRVRGISRGARSRPSGRRSDRSR